MLNYQRSLKYEHALMYMYRRKCREKTSHSVHKRTVVRRYGWNDNITFTVQPCPYPGCQACNVLMKLLKNRLKFKSLVRRSFVGESSGYNCSSRQGLTIQIGFSNTQVCDSRPGRSFGDIFIGRALRSQ